MKPFTIKKATNQAPSKINQSMMSQGPMDSQMQSYATGSPQKPFNGQSLLSQEEQEALKPKEVKVDNPWIYQQTHQEYLDNIKVSGLANLPPFASQ